LRIKGDHQRGFKIVYGRIKSEVGVETNDYITQAISLHTI